MGMDAIAYGPEEECLLTIDGADLLAHDAHGASWIARSARARWSRSTRYDGRIEAFTGTASEILVVRTTVAGEDGR